MLCLLQGQLSYYKRFLMKTIINLKLPCLKHLTVTKVKWLPQLQDPRDMFTPKQKWINYLSQRM